MAAIRSTYTKTLLLALLIIAASALGSISSHAQSVYSHIFEEGIAYTPGTPQFDDWASFRASLPSSDVTSITLSGSRDPIGRTCDDPAIAQQIVDAMRAGANGLPPGEITLSVDCGGFTWNTGSCPDDSGPTNNLELNVGSVIDMCDCQDVNPNWTIRPIVSDGDWGGIDGLTCDAPTQTITVLVNANFSRPIPALSEWGLIAMAAFLGIAGFILIRRRQSAA